LLSQRRPRLISPCCPDIEGSFISLTPVLSSAQQRDIALFAAGSSARAAAESAGVHRNTITNWLASFEFRRALARAQYENSLFLREQAQSLVPDAYNAIRAA